MFTNAFEGVSEALQQAYIPMSVIDFFAGQFLAGVLLAFFFGLLVGAALVAGFNIRKYRGTSRSVELNRRLQDAESRYEKEVATKEANTAFFANMSHELRTPFQGLLGMLDLVGNSPLDDQQREYLSTAQRSAHHLLGVLNDILDVSAMDSGMFSLSPSPMSLRQVLQDAGALLGQEAQNKGLKLEVTCDSDVPLWVAGDETRVRQILFNLLSNALKFTREGRISVRIRRSTSHANGVVMSVQDTGSGMDNQTVQQLFTRFFQADNTRKRRAGGTGLGLEISRNLARMMDGDIHVASQPGVGSTFTVLLILPSCEARESTLPSELMALDDREDDLVSRPGLHFLVADDHPINLQYLLHLLRSLGHEATLCDNGQEALSLAQQRLFDALLLDYHMPDMDGLAVTRAIRSGPAPFAGVKILLITADVVNDTRLAAREAGVDAFLSKPLKSQDLQRALLACGLHMPHSPAGLRHPARTQFVMSDYELPVNLDRPAQEQRLSGTSLVDWPAIHELVEVMTRSGLERQLQFVYRPKTGALADCVSNVLPGDCAQQRAAVHKLKGSLLLLGLEALAKHCASGEDRLTASPGQPLDSTWTRELIESARKTRDELAPHFYIPAPAASGSATRWQPPN